MSQKSKAKQKERPDGNRKKTSEETLKQQREFYHANKEYILAQQKLTKLERQKQLSLLPEEKEAILIKLRAIVDAYKSGKKKFKRLSSIKRKTDLSKLTEEEKAEHKRKVNQAWYKKNKTKHNEQQKNRIEKKRQKQKEAFIKAFNEKYG